MSVAWVHATNTHTYHLMFSPWPWWCDIQWDLSAGLLCQWVHGMQKGYKKHFASPKQTLAQEAATVEHLCTYTQHAITAALALDLQSHTSGARPVLRAAAATQHGQMANQPPQVADKPSPTAVPPVQLLVSPVESFIAALIGPASKELQASAALRLLKLAQSLVDAMQQQGCEAAAEQVVIMLDPKSAIGQLR